VNFLDQIPLGLVLLISIVGQFLLIDLGYRFGKYRENKSYKPQMAQVRAIMGASLGLLAFMLAFTFSIAQQHYEERVRAYMMEISAIDSAYRGADLLDSSQRALAQDLLRDFANLRLQTTEAARLKDVSAVVDLIRESERIHDQLWSIAESAMEDGSGRVDAGIFVNEVLAMINAHDARLQAALFNRISPIIWVTLLLMAMLSMLVMGYQAGLTGTRSTLATLTLAILFSVVMTIITDLDRPNMSLFRLNQELMLELKTRMSGEVFWDSASRES
jgi:hypothetical protein